MEFRLLGPVEAVRDGEPIQLGAPKQRALAAVLLLSANDVLAREGLVDRLWGGEPPRSAVQSLQVYVHGLRQALGSERVETHGTGYRIRVEPDELDLEEFERLVKRGERALVDGRPADASDDLRSALRLWRGSPLADLGGELVGQTEAPRLEDRRLRAVELQNDAELALGNHEELTVKLERLIAAEPYRERFRAQQMLALYRAGRQKEALEAYRSAHEALVEELGVEPSPALQELERQILRHDPTLAAPATPERGRVRLPAPPTALIGRKLEAVAASALLRRDDLRLLTLTGPGGTGKTRLALVIAEELAHDLRDGAVFVDLAPLRDPALIAPTIAHALGVSEGASAEEALIDHLRDRSMLLLLDNLEQLLPDVTIVGRLLAAAPRLRVLATSRSPLRLAAEQEYAVPPLELPERTGATFEELAANDAVRLFAARARAVDLSFALSEENVHDVVQICKRVDGLPLAIELAAARTKLFPPDSINRRFDRRLELLTGGATDRPSRQQALRSTLEWSHELLKQDEQALFARLAVFVGGWTLESAEAICSDNGTCVPETMSALVDNSLVRRLERPNGKHMFAMLETIHEFAAEQLARSDKGDALKRKHAEHFLAIAERAFEDSLSDTDAAFAVFDDVHDNVRAAVAWAAESGEIELEVKLLTAVWDYLSVRGHLSEGRRLFEDAIARSARGPPELHALAQSVGASFPYRQGDFARARELSEEALPVFRELGDIGEMSRCVGTLGNVAVSEGDLDRAVALYEEAADLTRQMGNEVRLAIVLANLGAIASIQDDEEGSARYAQEAAEIQRRIGALDGLAVSLHNLGRAQLRLGKSEEGRAALGESMEIALGIGYREVIAYCLGGMAEVAVLDGENERAALLIGKSQDVFGDIGAAIDPDESETQERILGQLHHSLGREQTDSLRASGAALELDELVRR
jgi:predicted ATPase/DNA-binding SARP family transcriptional activator